MTTLDFRPDAEARVASLRDAVATLLAGYEEMARMLSDVDPQAREVLLTPLRRAADTAAAVLAAT